MNLDKFGISASLLCAIHCAMMPVLLPIAALAGLGFLWTPAFEAVMILIALAVGAYSITNGYLKIHQTLYPMLFLVGGFLLIIGSKTIFDHALEHVLLPVGSLLIVVSHWLNWRLYKQHTEVKTIAH